ncbi:MAG: hypothetical protein IMY72_05440 [Bacteroidetes bacterium]|nr:hypothetical protein [Bacteroidota bacterium]
MKKISIQIKNGEIYNLQLEGLQKTEVNGLIYITINKSKDLIKNDDIIEFCKKNNGITISKNSNKIEIYNDPFRTIPLFITKSNSNEILIFSDFADFKKLNIPVTTDTTGFWEIALFGFALATRTAFNEVKQMTSASKIIISTNNKYKITPYWNFEIYKKKDNLSPNEAVKQLDNHLTTIFSKNLIRNKKYIMGLSGGLDSRLSSAYISKYLNKNSVRFFTFGYDKKTLEYTLSKKVANTLNFNKPDFYLLTKKKYLASLNSFSDITAGLISFQHAHIYSYLKNTSKTILDFTFISNYYSDAIFGFCTKLTKDTELKNSWYYNTIQNKKNLLTESVYEKIFNDIELIFKRFETKSNFSTFDEFIYIVEKNPKFHNYLSFLYSNFTEILSPYTNFTLLNYMISLPFAFRKEKGILDELLKKYFPNLSFEDNSSRLATDSSFRLWMKQGPIEYLKYLFLKINVLFILVGLKFQLKSKYLTEDHRALFHKYLRPKYRGALNFMSQKKIITTQQLKHFSRLTIRHYEYSIRLNLINLANVIKKFNTFQK